jgi:hypothetical protein
VQVLIPALAQLVAGDANITHARVEVFNQIDVDTHRPSSRLFVVFALVALVKICTIKALRDMPFVSA